jgi:predicted RNA binding protein YcfA (HicA-like mRNA interferase family)
MIKLPAINFRIMNRLLISIGFERIRQKGSHVFYRHSDGRTTTLPSHKGRDLAKPLIREILREIELTPEELFKKLHSG